MFDSIIESPVLKSISNVLNENVFAIIFVLTMGFSLLLVFKIRNNQKMYKKLKTIEDVSEVKTERKKGTNLQYFKKLKKACERYFHLIPTKHLQAQYMYDIILAVEFFVFLFCLGWKKPIFAIALPLMIHYFAIAVLGFISNDIHRVIQNELSNAIKQMVKVFSKTSDLKTVLYETSKHMNEPLKSHFFNLSRRMISENYEKCLLEFGDEIDDIWMHSLVFLLISYKEHSRKDDIIKNLRTLADILDKEDYTRKKALTEKKPMAMLNYVLLIIGLLCFAGNVAFNESAVNFFFSTMPGMICVCLGIGASFVTVIVNLMLVYKAEGR